jgi:EmrB/QacA subfamily drug resistance transporter
LDRRWKTLLLVSVGSFMAFLDAPVVSIAFPSIRESFPEASTTTLSWVLNVYFLAFAALLVVGGKLADRYGRRRVFLAGMWLFTAASLACAAAPSAGALIAARAVQAAGAAIVVPAGQGLMLAAFPPDQRKKAIGVLAAIVGLATAASPSIGAVLVEWADWRLIFYINVGVGLAAIVYGARLLAPDEQPDTRAPLPDALGAVLQAAALGLLVVAILKRADWGLGDPRTLGALAIAAAALAAFVWRSAHHPAPVVELSLLRVRDFAVANMASVSFAVGFYAVTLNSVLFLTQVWHYSILDTGLAVTPGALVGMLAGGPAGKLAESHGSRVVAVVGALTAAIGIGILVLSTGQDSNYLLGWLPGAIIYSVGAVTAFTALVGAAVTAAPPERFALASGFNAAVRQLGGALGVAAVVGLVADTSAGSILDRTHSAFAMAGIALLVASAVALLMSGRTQKAAAPQPRPDHG